jgi:hypothetical protein
MPFLVPFDLIVITTEKTPTPLIHRYERYSISPLRGAWAGYLEASTAIGRLRRVSTYLPYRALLPGTLGSALKGTWAIQGH